MRARSPLTAAGLALSLVACIAPPAPAPARAGAPRSYAPAAGLPGAIAISFTLPRGGGPPPFFELPWPSELLRREDERLELSRFPGKGALVFDAYVAAAERDLDGYSVAPTIYFHFTRPITAPAARAIPANADSPVLLVDVDPASPERGGLVPLEQRYYPRALRFVPAGTLAVEPQPGFVLRPGTLYAAVVRRSYGGGDLLGTTVDLELTKWTSPRADPAEEKARRLHQPAYDALEGLGLLRDQIAAIALFRTHIPHAVTARMLEVALRIPKDRAPRVVSATRLGTAIRGGYSVIEGLYCTPNFQDHIERAPFLAEDGGRVTLDESGAPRVVELPEGSPYRSRECGGLIRGRFVLTVPRAAMPAAGWPLMVSSHGTGGDAESFLGRNDFAGWAARQGIAVVSTDQPLHGKDGPGPRPGSREPLEISLGGLPIPLGVESSLAFYNPIHPAAARDNLRQAAVDGMILARVIAATDFARTRGADGRPLLTGSPAGPRFDGDRILVAGHSQGSQSMAVQGALDPLVRGVVLSGCGGDARLGIVRRKDLAITPIFATLMGLEAGELDEFHPAMALVQTLADPVDPASYARLYWEPLPGHRPQNVLHYEGMSDTFNPPITAEALAVALHATPLLPIVKRLPALSAREAGLADLLGRGEPTRAFAQFESTRAENGHFVLYAEPAASELLMQFVKAVVR